MSLFAVRHKKKGTSAVFFVFVCERSGAYAENELRLTSSAVSCRHIVF